MTLIKKVQFGSILGATLLVAGTSIGGGMLALPVATGSSGFFPSLTLLLVCWAFMTTTGLLLLEANLWMKEEGAHIISMASRFLGTPGKVVGFVVYLFIGYSSLVAYIAGGGALLQEAIRSLMGIHVDQWLAFVIFISLFGFVIDLGARVVGRVNAILVVAMIFAYLCLMSFGFSQITSTYLMHQDYTKTIRAAPIVLTVFSFQFIIPSLTIYLKKNAKALRFAIIAGTTITLIVYIIWELLVLGTVPLTGSNGLLTAFIQGNAATEFYREAVGSASISIIAGFFAFFALATSFLGVGLGLFDFLADGLKIKKKGRGKVQLGILIIVPSLLFALAFERIFLVALDASGGFGDAILNGILPVLMVWVGRYRDKLTGEFTFPGGKILLSLVLLFFVSILALEIIQTFAQPQNFPWEQEIPAWEQNASN